MDFTLKIFFYIYVLHRDNVMKFKFKFFSSKYNFIFFQFNFFILILETNNKILIDNHTI